MGKLASFAAKLPCYQIVPMVQDLHSIPRSYGAEATITTKCGQHSRCSGRSKKVGILFPYPFDVPVLVNTTQDFIDAKRLPDARNIGFNTGAPLRRCGSRPEVAVALGLLYSGRMDYAVVLSLQPLLIDPGGLNIYGWTAGRSNRGFPREGSHCLQPCIYFDRCNVVSLRWTHRTF
jgi:hypothetical protein